MAHPINIFVLVVGVALCAVAAFVNPTPKVNLGWLGVAFAFASFLPL